VTEKVTFSHCVPTIIQMLLGAEAAKSVDLKRLEGDHRRLGAAGGAGPQPHWSAASISTPAMA
jgi:hypothetical protein